jgi:hypothetical protein
MFIARKSDKHVWRFSIEGFELCTLAVILGTRVPDQVLGK